MNPTRVVSLVGAALLLAGCATGARPTLGPTVPVGGTPGSPTGNAVVDAVLQRLETASRPAFTATYQITRKLGPSTTTGTVVHDGSKTSVTVGDVRFVQGTQTVTCSLSQQRCENGTLDARISDYSVSSAFYGPSPARALRVAYSRRSAEPSQADRSIAGVAATCADVPVGSGHELYCATDAGTIARWDTAAVDIELEQLQAVADPSAFVVPGG